MIDRYLPFVLSPSIDPEQVSRDTSIDGFRSLPGNRLQ
jgi:hypothetical protein